MKDKDKTPLAFPASREQCISAEANKGMTLRDYFAAENISELVRAETDNYRMIHSKEQRKSCLLNAAAIAYEIADAMLNERSKKT